MMTKVGIYARLSRNRDGESTSIERQLEACRSRMEPGWSEVKVYRDDDISAYSGKVRPGFEEMLADAEAGRIDLVLSYALDRLGRRPKDIERLLEMGVRFICVRDSLDSSTASSELFIRILAAMAKMESDNTSARLRLKHKELRDKGMFSGGRVPYGWKPGEAEVLRDAARRVIAGESLRSICIRTGLDARNLKRKLLNPKMIGKRDPNGAVGMPVILSEEEWRKVQAIFTSPARRGMREGAKHLLTGLAVCGLCGRRLYYHKDRTRIRYACNPAPPGCNRLNISAKRLEEFVLEKAWEKAWATFHSREKRSVRAGREKGEDKKSQLRQELQQLREKLYPLMDMYTEGSLSFEEWRHARDPIDTRIREIESALKVETPTPVDSLEIPLKGGDQRLWLAGLIERVVVHPSKERGSRFDSTRIDVQFR